MMIELSVVRDLVAIFGVIAGFSYYVLTVRNNQKNQRQQLETRQAQLFMQVYNRFNEKSFVNQINDIRYRWEFSDVDDFFSKYGTFENPEAWDMYISVIYFFEGLGVLIHKKLINPEIVDDLMSGVIISIWEKYGPMIVGLRERLDMPAGAEWFEYLYHQIKSIYMEQHPEYADKSIMAFNE